MRDFATDNFVCSSRRRCDGFPSYLCRVTTGSFSPACECFFFSFCVLCGSRAIKVIQSPAIDATQVPTLRAFARTHVRRRNGNRVFRITGALPRCAQ